MSWLSKAAKSVEKSVSHTAKKAGVGKDLRKAANIFGAANVGGAAGIVTGFLTGGAPGAIYGGVTGGITAGYGKYKGDNSKKYISNAAGTGAIAGGVGPLIYKPASAALITAPGPVSGYGTTTTVKTASGGLLGTFSNPLSAVSNVFKDAVAYIGKGGLVQIATDGLKNLFSGKTDPSRSPNPDYQEGNAVAPGTNFTQWLNGVLPGKSYDPTAPGASTSGGGGSNPSVTVENAPGFSSSDGGGIDLKPVLWAAGIAGGLFLLTRKGGLKLAH